jgi:RimJ/RimL family protein N-acetyltransferase
VRRPEPVVLEGHGVRLEPLTRAHVPDLLAVAQDDDVWRFLSLPQPRDAAAMTAVVDAAAVDRTRVAWAVVVAARAVGSTSYLDVDLAVRGLEVGWTWYAREVWATHVNSACKRLLLGHAFDDLDAQRVTFKLDARNSRSFRAVERLGAQYDGTLRHHRLRADGTVRDSAYFSVLAAEWPDVRAGLDARLARPAHEASTR